MTLRAAFHDTDWPLLARRSGSFVLFEPHRPVAIADTINIDGTIMLDLDSQGSLEKIDIQGTHGLPLRYASPRQGARYSQLRLMDREAGQLIVRTVKAQGEARLTWSDRAVDCAVSLGPDLAALVAGNQLLGLQITLDC